MNSLADTSLEPIEALLRALAGVSVSSRVGDVSSVDDNPLAATGDDESGLVPHSEQHNLHHGISLHHLLQHQTGFASTILPFQETQVKISDAMAKMENEVATVNQDMAYFRHVLDFQNLKIEKLTQLLIDLLHNKDVSQIINLLQNIQSGESFNVGDGQDSVDDLLPDSVHDPVHDAVHDVTGGLQSLLSPNVVPESGNVSVSGVLLDSSMDPQLHQVAQAAVQAQNKPDMRQAKRVRKRGFPKMSASNGNGMSSNNNNHNHNTENGNGMSNNSSSSSNDTNANNNNNNNSINMGSHVTSNSSTSSVVERMVKHRIHIPGHIQLLRNQHQQLIQHSQHLHHSQHSQHPQHALHSQLSQQLQKQQAQRQKNHVQHSQGQLQDREPSGQQQNRQHLDLQQQQQQQQDAKRSMSVLEISNLEVVSMDNMNGRKRPKVSIDFLHNPMTVKEIYDEFTIGFRGQPPLREMDERYGKHEWRGDSRSKESKRFQRRKKLCDAIERGMQKYGKTAEQILEFIEDFRGDKSLTWVMNGNLPSDLME